MSNYPNSNKDTKNKFALSNVSNSNFNLNGVYASSDIHIDSVEEVDNIIYLYCKSSKSSGICPYCGSESGKVHSRYVRYIHDLSILGKQVTLIFESRKFFCLNECCLKKTFAEQPGNEVFRYRRRTRRCEVAVTRQGLSTSSGIASKLLSMTGVPLSRSTILRDVHRLYTSDYKDITEIGVDDWAWRKGVTYGSIIIDLHLGIPIDVLGDREMDSFRSWLNQHQSVRLVSRDRSTDYSSAIASTGNNIIEIADKFHLIKNISERMKQNISANYQEYRAAVRATEQPIEEHGNVDMESDIPVRQLQQKMERKEDSRCVKFREVKELQALGYCPTAIAKKLRISRQTATKYCQIDALPERGRKCRNGYERYDRYVEEEASKGKSLVRIFSDIRDKGFKGSLTPFYDHYRYLSDGHKGFRSKKELLELAKKPKRKTDNRSSLIPLKRLSAIVDKSIYDQHLKNDETSILQTLQKFEWFGEFYEASKSFCSIIKGDNPCLLIRWIKKYWHTKNRNLRTFIYGVKMDYQAIRNTIKYDVTNGITEGFVNKLKVMKRIMYGRAGIDLLKRKMVMEYKFFN